MSSVEVGEIYYKTRRNKFHPSRASRANASLIKSRKPRYDGILINRKGNYRFIVSRIRACSNEELLLLEYRSKLKKEKDVEKNKRKMSTAI